MRYRPKYFHDILWRGNGALSLEWLPHPHLSARIAPEESGRAPMLEPAEIAFVELAVGTSAYVSRTPVFLSGSGRELVQAVVPSVKTGSTGPFHRIRFHVPNFPDLTGANIRTPEGGPRWARLTMSGGGWRITLDPIRMQNVMQELPIAVGYALTHVGTLEREDGCSFGFNDAEEILHCLTYFLSFCRASWVGPILCSGEDSEGASLGTKWDVRRIDPYSRGAFLGAD